MRPGEGQDIVSIDNGVHDELALHPPHGDHGDGQAEVQGDTKRRS